MGLTIYKGHIPVGDTPSGIDQWMSQPRGYGPSDWWLVAGYSTDTTLTPTRYSLMSLKYDGAHLTVGDLVGTNGSIPGNPYTWLRGGNTWVDGYYYGASFPGHWEVASRTGQKTVYTVLTDGSIRAVVVNLPVLPSTWAPGHTPGVDSYRWQWMRTLTSYSGDMFVVYAIDEYNTTPDRTYLAASYQVAANGDVTFLGSSTATLGLTGAGGYWGSSFPNLDHNSQIAHVADNVVLGPSMFAVGGSGDYYRTVALDLTAPLSPWVTSTQLVLGSNGTGIGYSGLQLSPIVPLSDWDTPGFWAYGPVNGTLRRFDWSAGDIHAGATADIGPITLPQLGIPGAPQFFRDGTLAVSGYNSGFTQQEVYWNIGETTEYSYKTGTYDLQSTTKMGNDIIFLSSSFTSNLPLIYSKPSVALGGWAVGESLVTW